MLSIIQTRHFTLTHICVRLSISAVARQGKLCVCVRLWLLSHFLYVIFIRNEQISSAFTRLNFIQEEPSSNFSLSDLSDSFIVSFLLFLTNGRPVISNSQRQSPSKSSPTHNSLWHHRVCRWSVNGLYLSELIRYYSIKLEDTCE